MVGEGGEGVGVEAIYMNTELMRKKSQRISELELTLIELHLRMLYN